MRVQIAASTPSECLLWDMSLNTHGYGQIYYMGKVMKAHRVAYHMHYGHFPVHGACHTCDNRNCFNPHHLFDGDQRANMRDAAGKGRFLARAASSIDPAEVFKLTSTGMTAAAIARFMGISPSYVCLIQQGRRRNRVVVAA